MATTYISKLARFPSNGQSEEYIIGSGLYGICSTSSNIQVKSVTLDAFDTLQHGITIHVRFENGNEQNYISLKVGGSIAKQVINPGGTLSWSANAVISFTYDSTYENNNGAWIVNGGGGVTNNSVEPSLKYMIFKGTIGDDRNATYTDIELNTGQITVKAGDTYKILTTFNINSSYMSTNMSTTVKAGDVIIVNDQLKWVVIPAGNDDDLYIAKGSNNNDKFLQGNNNWVYLQSTRIADTQIIQDANTGVTISEGIVLHLQPMVGATGGENNGT